MPVGRALRMPQAWRYASLKCGASSATELGPWRLTARMAGEEAHPALAGGPHDPVGVGA